MRPAHASIDLSALRHNFRIARKHQGGRLMAVVKADAYGHGALECAQALAGEADGFAVSCVEEGLELRAAGIRNPLLLLEGFFHADELELCVRHDLWLVIHSFWQLEVLERMRLNKRLNCWIKLDSGMHRIGFFACELASVYQRLQASGNVAQMVVMTHMAQADNLESPVTEQQLAVLRQAVQGLDVQTSLGNSAALLGWPQTAGDWSRPGIMLYGCNPFLDVQAMDMPLQPVMTLESRIIAVRDLPEGEAVGYGARFVTHRPTRLGVVAMGYADGYPRHAREGTPVLVDGSPVALAGRVSMDMLTVDLTDAPGAGLGSRVELWGKSLSADAVAVCADTISYCLLTAVKRVRRSWING